MPVPNFIGCGTKLLPPSLYYGQDGKWNGVPIGECGKYPAGKNIAKPPSQTRS